MKGRIKLGIIVGQDFSFIKGPDDLDIIFDIKLVGANLKKCIAPGFGKRGDYGNGAIYVSDPDGIEVIKDEKAEKGTLKCSVCGGDMEPVWNHETRSFKWYCEDCYDSLTKEEKYAFD